MTFFMFENVFLAVIRFYLWSDAIIYKYLIFICMYVFFIFCFLLCITIFYYVFFMFWYFFKLFIMIVMAFLIFYYICIVPCKYFNIFDSILLYCHCVSMLYYVFIVLLWHYYGLLCFCIEFYMNFCVCRMCFGMFYYVLLCLCATPLCCIMFLLWFNIVSFYFIDIL